MKRLAITILLAAASSAQAHFLFMVPDAAGSTARVFISETLEPDPAVAVSTIEGAQLTLRDANGNESPVTLLETETNYLATLPGTGQRLLHGTVDLGTMQTTGDPYRLLYYSKAILGDAFDTRSVAGGDPVELIPVGAAGALRLRLIGGGKPLADAEVTVITPDGASKIVKTNAAGETETFSQSGQYGAWARYWEDAAGEHDGVAYKQLHHYAMLTFVADAQADAGPASAGAAGSDKTATLLATLPEASASLGAVVSDGWLYVYGGHVSPTHSYFDDAVSGRFHRMRVNGEGGWEELPAGPHVQGMNLAAHKGMIYRIGGMTPQNQEGEPTDTVSIAGNARYDPATRRWEDLPPLPEPRSSHDVVVIGDQLIVTAGWNMQGTGGQTTWADTTLILDLAADRLEWKSVLQPFQRRALMAAAYNGKMWVIGGITSEEAIVRDVSVFDPQTETWTEGPQLPQGPWIAFSPAAGVHEGKLYASVSDGTLLRLNEATLEWEKAGKGAPRVAHRLVSGGGKVLVIGGANSGENSDLVEAFEVN